MKHFPCSDYLKIIDKNNVTVAKYCGKLTGKFSAVDGKYVVMTFHSRGKYKKRGFVVSFTASPATHSCKCNHYHAWSARASSGKSNYTFALVLLYCDLLTKFL